MSQWTEHNKRYYEQNRQRCIERSRNSQLARAEEIKLYNREYGKKWRQTDRAKRLKRRDAARRRAGKSSTPQPIEYQLHVMSDPCAYCGVPAEHLDHIVPLSRGGKDQYDNWAAACGSCNVRKSAKSLLQFLGGDYYWTVSQGAVPDVRREHRSADGGRDS